MRKEPKELTFDEFADELLKEKQPRALVILAAAKIDTQLRSVIEKILLPKLKAKDPDELLEGDNPLATFSAKTKMCRRLGLIDDSIANALDRLRDVRNQAARWVTFGLADAPLRDQCKNLRSLIQSRRSYRLTVERFFVEPELDDFEALQATLLTVAVLLESVYENAKPKAAGNALKMPKLN